MDLMARVQWLHPNRTCLPSLFLRLLLNVFNFGIDYVIDLALNCDAALVIVRCHVSMIILERYLAYSAVLEVWHRHHDSTLWLITPAILFVTLQNLMSRTLDLLGVLNAVLHLCFCCNQIEILVCLGMDLEHLKLSHGRPIKLMKDLPVVVFYEVLRQLSFVKDVDLRDNENTVLVTNFGVWLFLLFREQEAKETQVVKFRES